jgi:hypothetical protein
MLVSKSKLLAGKCYFLPVYWPLLDRFWLYHIIYDVAKASPLICSVVIYKIKEVTESLLNLLNYYYYYFNQMKDEGDGSTNTNDEL